MAQNEGSGLITHSPDELREKLRSIDKRAQKPLSWFDEAGFEGRIWSNTGVQVKIRFGSERKPDERWSEVRVDVFCTPEQTLAGFGTGDTLEAALKEAVKMIRRKTALTPKIKSLTLACVDFSKDDGDSDGAATDS